MSTIDTTNETELADLAERGRQAAETLAAADLARREARTTALAAAQSAWDEQTCRRGPDLDADLADQRKVALQDLEAAVERDELGEALAAWRREAAARQAQRALRETWRSAHARCGVGRAPAPQSMRSHEADEAQSFLAVLSQAASRSAAAAAEDVAAELIGGERPTAVASELLPGPEAALAHAPGCQHPDRTETRTVPSGTRSQGKVLRCLSCSASTVLYMPPPEPEELEAQASRTGIPDVRVAGAWDSHGQVG